MSGMLYPHRNFSREGAAYRGHGESGARAYNGSGAELPAGSRDSPMKLTALQQRMKAQDIAVNTHRPGTIQPANRPTLVRPLCLDFLAFPCDAHL